MKYAIISNQKRAILLERVLVDKESIKLVADELKIKFPSAKSIIRTYKKTGRIFNKKKSRKVPSNLSDKDDSIDQELCSMDQMIQKQKNVENQEKSQKITTQNINQKREEQTKHFFQYQYEMSGQPFYSYPLFIPMINQPYIQFPMPQYYGPNYQC